MHDWSLPDVRSTSEFSGAASVPITYVTKSYYLHVMTRKEIAPLAADPDFGARLWEATQKLLTRR